MIDTDKYYTLQEAAEILSVKVDTLRRQCRVGKMKCSDIGLGLTAKYRIKGETILNLLNK